jgi:hypothetical protein
MTTQNLDATAIRIHLNELKTKFDDAMYSGEEFSKLKRIYMEIKELECCLNVNVLEWQANNGRVQSRNHDKKYHGRIKQSPPLL